MDGNGREEEFVSVEEAARELGTTPTKVLMMLRSKALSGCEADGEWRVGASSLACAKTHGVDRKEVAGCAAYCKSKCGCG
jgi:hypothetical protein